MTLQELSEEMLLVDDEGEWWQAMSEEGCWWLRCVDGRDRCVETDLELAGFRPFFGRG
jgi:hypothetical protein